MDTSPSENGAPCRQASHRAVPIFAIIIGLEFFLAEIGILTWEFVNVTWPLLLVIAGIVGLFDHRYHYHDR